MSAEPKPYGRPMVEFESSQFQPNMVFVHGQVSHCVDVLIRHSTQYSAHYKNISVQCCQRGQIKQLLKIGGQLGQTVMVKDRLSIYLNQIMIQEPLLSFSFASKIRKEKKFHSNLRVT